MGPALPKVELPLLLPKVELLLLLLLPPGPFVPVGVVPTPPLLGDPKPPPLEPKPPPDEPNPPLGPLPVLLFENPKVELPPDGVAAVPFGEPFVDPVDDPFGLPELSELLLA